MVTVDMTKEECDGCAGLKPRGLPFGPFVAQGARGHRALHGDRRHDVHLRCLLVV